MRIEGIVLNTKKFQERHLVVDLLCRSGHKLSSICYGAAGGGKQAKPQGVVVGCSYEFEVKLGKGSLASASEWTRKWNHSEIENSYKAYYLLLFFTELLNKSVAPSDEALKENTQYYNLLSNSIFYLNDSLAKKKFEKNSQLTLFMVKLLKYSGLIPDFGYCALCGKTLEERKFIFLVGENGFICNICGEDSVHGHGLEAGGRLQKALSEGSHLLYKEYGELQAPGVKELKALVDFYLYHNEISSTKLNTYGFVF